MLKDVGESERHRSPKASGVLSSFLNPPDDLFPSVAPINNNEFLRFPFLNLSRSPTIVCVSGNYFNAPCAHDICITQMSNVLRVIRQSLLDSKVFKVFSNFRHILIRYTNIYCNLILIRFFIFFIIVFKLLLIFIIINIFLINYKLYIFFTVIFFSVI